MTRARRIVLAIALLLTLSPAAFTQAGPTFETATVKPCKHGEMRPGIDAGGGNGKRPNVDAARGPSPGYLELNCYPLLATGPWLRRQRKYRRSSRPRRSDPR